MDRNAPLLFEMFGQPGAGKTTLVREVMADPSVHTTSSLALAWKHRSMPSKLFLFARALLAGGCIFHAARLMWLGRLSNPDSIARLCRLIVKAHWIREQSGTLLLEEGVMQDLWSIHYSSSCFEPDPRHVANLIGSLFAGVNTVIVFVDIDPDVALERILARADGKSRLDRLGSEHLRRQLIKTATLPRRLVDAALLAGLKVRNLDASLPKEESIRGLKAMLATGGDTIEDCEVRFAKAVRRSPFGFG